MTKRYPRGDITAGVDGRPTPRRDSEYPGAPKPLTPDQIRERAEHLRQKDDELNARYIAEGWGRAAFDMGVEPKDLESGARRALLHAREDIAALHKALVTVAAKVDDGMEVLPPMLLAAVNRVVGKYRL